MCEEGTVNKTCDVGWAEQRRIAAPRRHRSETTCWGREGEGEGLAHGRGCYTDSGLQVGRARTGRGGAAPVGLLSVEIKLYP